MSEEIAPELSVEAAPVLPIGDAPVTQSDEEKKAASEKAFLEKDQAKLKKLHEENLKKYKINSKGQINFSNNQMYFPVTFGQLQDLCNELLTAMNILTQPFYLTPEYMLQVLTSAMHGIKDSAGITSKKELFGVCVKKIAMHVSYDATKEIQAKIRQEAKDKGQPVAEFSDPTADESDEVSNVPQPEAAPAEAASATQ